MTIWAQFLFCFYVYHFQHINASVVFTSKVEILIKRPRCPVLVMREAHTHTHTHASQYGRILLCFSHLLPGRAVTVFTIFVWLQIAAQVIFSLELMLLLGKNLLQVELWFEPTTFCTSSEHFTTDIQPTKLSYVHLYDGPCRYVIFLDANNISLNH